MRRECPKILGFEAVYEQIENLCFSQSFFEKIVDISKIIMYNTKRMLRQFGYNCVLTDHNDMRWRGRWLPLEAGNFRRVCPLIGRRFEQTLLRTAIRYLRRAYHSYNPDNRTDAMCWFPFLKGEIWNTRSGVCEIAPFYKTRSRSVRQHLII